MSNASQNPMPARQVNPTIAANIRAELGYRNLSQSDLAAHLGQNEMWLSRRMTSRNQFGSEEIGTIADYFDIEPGELFSARHERKTGGGTTLVGLVKPLQKDWKLPGLDSNQEPIGSQSALVTNIAGRTAKAPRKLAPATRPAISIRVNG